MPPFHNRSTCAFRMALMTSLGVACAGSSSSACASRDRVRLLALREYTPPPLEMAAFE